MQKVIYIANCMVYHRNAECTEPGMSNTVLFYNVVDALEFVKCKTEIRPKNMRWQRGGDCSNRYLVDMYGSNEQLAVDITVERATIDDKES